MFGFELNKNGRLRTYSPTRRNYQTDVYARLAASFIRDSSSRRRPFFLTLSTLAPHTEPRMRAPLNPRPVPRHRGAFKGISLPKPPSFDEVDVSDKPAEVRAVPRLDDGDKRSLQQLYRARLESLLAVDDAVGRIVRELRRTNELRNTLIMFTSDNGYLLGEHRLKAKTELYEEATRVPLLIRGPGIPRGELRRQVTGNVDLAPTIVDVAGAQPGRVMDGRSLMPLARGPSVDADRDILLELPHHGQRAVRTPRYLYAEHPQGETELYDLRSDPFQLESMHVGGPHERPDSASLQRDLAERLRELEDCVGAGCR